MEENKNQEKQKRYLDTLILFLILGGLISFNLILPSRNEVKEVLVKEKLVKQENLIKINAYNFNYEKNFLEKYEIELREESMENILKYTLNDILEKNFTNEKIEIDKIYFGNNSAYLEFNNENIELDENIKEALLKTTQEIFSVSTLVII